MRGRIVRWGLIVAAGWTALHVAFVAGAWTRATLAPIDPVPRVFAMDLRADRAVAGRVVTIVATRPTPSKGDWIGHLWIAWPETPPGAPAGTREAGYYARSQMQAVGALAAALLAPWGFATGQAPVPGTLKVDDGWWRHLSVEVRVDEARYRAALAVDARWRRETRYSLRPGIEGVGPGRTWGCADYVFEVAEALGLARPVGAWAAFPMGSFLDFAALNGIEVRASAP